MPKVIVLHASYGCDTGCCGHVVEVDGQEVGRFTFDHPRSNATEDKIAFARDLVTKECGEAHVSDIDWVNSIIIDD